MAAAPVTPDTGTGVVESALLPQHSTAPLDTTAHASLPFVATAVAPLTPDTATGVVEQPPMPRHCSGPEVLPSPS